MHVCTWKKRRRTRTRRKYHSSSSLTSCELKKHFINSPLGLGRRLVVHCIDGSRVTVSSEAGKVAGARISNDFSLGTLKSASSCHTSWLWPMKHFSSFLNLSCCPLYIWWFRLQLEFSTLSPISGSYQNSLCPWYRRLAQPLLNNENENKQAHVQLFSFPPKHIHIYIVLPSHDRLLPFASR